MGLGRLFYLESGELRRALPFFGFYLLLCTMLATGDAVSTALFVKRVGMDEMPLYYGITALFNFVLMYFYMRWGATLSNGTMFFAILLYSVFSYLGAMGITFSPGVPEWGYGGLFVSRETFFTLALMHFGTFLQDYFTRSELNRVMPVVYAGGRLGGLLAGTLLGFFAKPLGLDYFSWMYMLLGLGLMFFLRWLIRQPQVEEPEFTEIQEAPISEESKGTRVNLTWIPWIQFRSPLLFWFSFNTFLFIVCRWLLNFQYNQFFQHHFVDEGSLGSFLGWYMTGALFLSFLIQLLVVNRLVALLGLAGSFLMYSSFMLTATGMTLFPLNIWTAMGIRFIETELRLGIRNPLSMMVTNQFEKPIRKQARAFSLGMIVPLATFMVSLALATMGHFEMFHLFWVLGGVTVIVGILHAWTAYRMQTWLR